MKKIILVLIAIIMCVSLCSCSSYDEEEIKRELESKQWFYNYGWDKILLTFDDDICTCEKYGYDNKLNKRYMGFYSIYKDGTILFTGEVETLSNTRESYIRYYYYTYKNGELRVYNDADHKNEFTKSFKY